MFTVDDLNAVDARMHAAFQNLSSWLSSHRQMQPGSAGRFLEILTSDVSYVYRRARRAGATSALLLHGLAGEIRDRPGSRSLIEQEPSCAQAREIRRHSTPAGAALKTIALLTDVDAETLGYLTLDQLVETPRGVTLGRYLLRGAGAAALRAYAADQSSRGHPPTAPLFTRRQLADHHRDDAEKPRDGPRGAVVRLAALRGSLDITMPQPELAEGFTAPAAPARQEAELVLRLLRLSPTRGLPLARLRAPEQEAAQRLVTTRAARVYDGALAATEHLRFSHFLADTPSYLAGVRSRRL